MATLFSYFSTESGSGTKVFYLTMMAYVVVYTFISMAAPLITPECDQPPPAHRTLSQGLEGGLEDAPNPSYRKDPCRWTRYVVLLGMNKWEADMCCRVTSSIFMGSIIGFERRRADRPAGIRTMAMTCLGACVFTIDSMFAFVDGTMPAASGWDASRVSAAIPSGVGFLGAASIWKGTSKTDGKVPEVHGLTTATSVWLSAAIGILCGGGLYVPAFFTTACAIVYLRFAPRLHHEAGDTPEEDLEINDRANPLCEPLDPNGTERTESCSSAGRRPSLGGAMPNMVSPKRMTSLQL